MSFCGGYAAVNATKGYTFLIDASDVEAVCQFDWFADVDRKGYCRVARFMPGSDGKRRKLPLASFLMPPDAAFVIDHRNGDSLDNRRQNLRAVSAQQNAWNNAPTTWRTEGSSRFKGVAKCGTRWEVRIRIKDRAVFRKTFRDEIAAARAYDEHAVRLFGEYARTNVGMGLIPS